MLGILVNTSLKIPNHRDVEMQAAYSIILQPFSVLAALSIGTEREGVQIGGVCVTSPKFIQSVQYISDIILRISYLYIICI